MKKKYFIGALATLLIIPLLYAAFKNDETWHVRDGSVVELKNYSVEDETIIQSLTSSFNTMDYVAIVYPRAHITKPNHWFHRVVLGDPYHRKHNIIKAEVEHTFRGKDYPNITYGSALSIGEIDNTTFPMLVMLCGRDEHNLHAQDVAYEFAISLELMEYLINEYEPPPEEPDSRVCTG